MTKIDVGDEMLRRGIIVPILAIDDAGCTIVVRDEGGGDDSHCRV